MHGVLLVDKPRGWTSHDVVAWVRKRLGVRTVGHGGTLDPAAEGLLLVALGVATRLTRYVIEADKTYVAHVVLGVATSTDDLEGELQESHTPPSIPTRATVEQALARFQGTFAQVPPVYSAIKLGGVAAHRRTRRGEAPHLQPRSVTVHRIQLLRYEFPDLFVAIDCAKGFYVRAFARDLARELGTVGYLHGLVRTRVGPFDLREAWTIEQLTHLLAPETWPLVARHPDCLLDQLPLLPIPESELSAWYHGAPVRCAVTASHGSLARAYAPDGSWIGGARYDAVGRYWHPELVHRARG